MNTTLKVNFSKNSWHYKLHTYMQGKNQKEYYNLCPYFWITLLYVSLYPFTFIHRLIAKQFTKIKSRKKRKSLSDSTVMKISKLLMTLLSYTCLYFLSFSFTLIFLLIHKDHSLLMSAVWIIIAVSIIFAFVYTLVSIEEYLLKKCDKNSKDNKVKKLFSFIFLYIKSTKEKYCPEIIWDSDKK